jgi:DNA primase
MPLAWDEVARIARSRRAATDLDTAATMRRWNIENVPKLLATSGDPWRREWKPQRLERALDKAVSAWR